jgi:hypothetical protein
MRWKSFNERVALRGTAVFGSMWTCYAFCIWGLLGMLPGCSEPFKEFVLMVSSSWLQLFALPLLAVGNAVTFRLQEKRAKEDHSMLKTELEKINSMSSRLDRIEAAIERIERYILKAA